MRFIEQRIAQAEILFERYKGQEPLHLFLKKYFKKNKKFGSRDRKEIAECLYAVYRIGRENRHLTVRNRVFFYLYLKGDFDADFFIENYPELAQTANSNFSVKLEFLRNNYALRQTFRMQEAIAERINLEDYRNSFYAEPLVFVRFRNGSEKVQADLIKELDGQFLENACVAFGQKVKLENHFKPADYVVQDYNSQQTANYFPALKSDDTVWDACAGSGGKSILLLDQYPKIDLTVTDIRASILRSLLGRFEQYDLNVSMLAELNVNKEKELAILEERMFDFIICDVPCTGSGTWARTPEQFYFFEKKGVRNFHRRQLDILQNASTRLKTGGELLYITCSVFTEENEAVVKDFLATANQNFESVSDAYLDGTRMQADTLYINRIKRVK